MCNFINWNVRGYDRIMLDQSQQDYNNLTQYDVCSALEKESVMQCEEVPYSRFRQSSDEILLTEYCTQQSSEGHSDNDIVDSNTLIGVQYQTQA